MKASVVLVTATSFMRSLALREELERSLSPHSIVYLDLKTPEGQRTFSDPEFGKTVAAWLVGGEPVAAAELALFPRLGIVSKYGVGVDNIDYQACAARSVQVYAEFGVNSLAVAEHTLGLILSVCRNLAFNSRLLSQGVWNKDGGRGLQGMLVGIVGLGHVGSRLASLLAALGAKLYYADIEAKPDLERTLRIQRLSYDELIRTVELVSFHVPLTDQTRRMFGERELLAAKPGLFLINTSRGAVVDESALKQGLKSGKIAGAALDVFEKEPLHDKELAESERLLGTPHTAGNSHQAVAAMGAASIRGITQYFIEKSAT